MNTNTALKLAALLSLFIHVGISAQGYPVGAKSSIPQPRPGSIMMMGFHGVLWDIFDEEPPITGTGIVGGTIQADTAEVQKKLGNIKDALNTFRDTFNTWYKQADTKLAKLTPKDLEKLRKFKNELRDWWDKNFGALVLKLFIDTSRKRRKDINTGVVGTAQKISPEGIVSVVEQEQDS